MRCCVLWVVLTCLAGGIPAGADEPPRRPHELTDAELIGKLADSNWVVRRAATRELALRILVHGPDRLREPLEAARKSKNTEQSRRATGLRTHWRDAIDDETIKAVAYHHRGLTAMDLTGIKITNAGLHNLRRLSKLASLKLGASRFSEAGLIHLTGLQSLRKLDIRGIALGDEGLKSISRIESLRELRLGDLKTFKLIHGRPTRVKSLPRITAAGFEVLSSLVNLERLTLPSMDFGDEGFGVMGKLSKLRYLKVSGWRGTAAAVAHITRCAAIEELDLSACEFKGAWVAELTKLPKLRELTLMGVGLTDADVAGMAKMPLTSLDVSYCEKLTSKVVDLVASMPLDHLGLQGLPITNADIARLKGKKRLKYLSLSQCKRLTDDCIPTLLQLTALEGVALYDTGITHAGTVRLRAEKEGCKVWHNCCKACEQAR